MSKKADDGGPFAVPESMFSEDKPDASFSDAEVEAIMGEYDASMEETTFPPPPPAPPNDQQWLTEGPPELNPTFEDTPEPPQADPPPGESLLHHAAQDAQMAAPEPPAPPPSPPAEPRASGLVMQSPDQDDLVEPAASNGDTASTAMTYIAMGIAAALVGVLFGGGTLFVMMTVLAPEPVEEVLPDKEVGNVEVRRTMKAPSQPNYIEENIRAFEEREAARERGELVEEPDVGTETEAEIVEDEKEEKPEVENDAPSIGGQLPD